MNLLKIFGILLGILFGSTHITTATAQATAKLVVLKCKAVSAGGSKTFDMTIDLSQNQIQYVPGLYEIQSVTEKSITGILVSHPKDGDGINVLVLNRGTGAYIIAEVGLHCEDKSCANQVGPDIWTYRRHCKRPVL